MESEQKYSGFWKINNDEIVYSGELSVNEDNHSLKLKILILDNKESSKDSESKFSHVKYINGKTINGEKVLLYDCTLIESMYSHEQYTALTISARYAFWGINIEKDDLTIDEVRFEYTIPLRWYNLCRYDLIFNEKEQTFNLEWINKGNVSLKYKDNLELVIAPNQGWEKMNKYRTDIIMQQQVLVYYKYKNSVSWETVLKDSQSVQYLLELASKDIVKIKQAQVCSYQCMDSESFLSVSWGYGKKAKSVEETCYWDFLFTLKDIQENLKVLDKWVKSYYELNPILDLHYIVNSGKGTEVTDFINLTQALETFHSRFIANDFKSYKELIEKMKDQNLDAEWERQLIQYNQGKKYSKDGNEIEKTDSDKSIFFKNRIAYLVYDRNNLPLDIDGMDAFAFINKIMNSRNYYTHYSKDKEEKAFDLSELISVNIKLHLLLEYHILAYIGFDCKKLKQKILRDLMA